MKKQKHQGRKKKFRKKRKNFSNRKEGDLQGDKQDIEHEERKNLMSRNTAHHRWDDKNEHYRRETHQEDVFLPENHDWMN